MGDPKREYRPVEEPPLPDRPVACFAGVVSGGDATEIGACYCRIEHIVMGRKNPRTYWGWCTDRYDLCPTWRLHADRSGSR